MTSGEKKCASVKTAAMLPILTCRKACPLKFNERLVYSCVIYRNKYSPATPYFIKATTGIHHRTVTKIVGRLKAMDLLANGDGGLTALEPAGDARDWFSWHQDEPEKRKGWAGRVRKWRMHFEDMPLVACGVLSVLRAECERKDKASATATGLAVILGVSVKAVRMALKRLAADAFITLEPTRKGFMVTVGNSPAPMPPKPKKRKEEDGARAYAKAVQLLKTPETERQRVERVVGKVGMPEVCECGKGGFRPGRWKSFSICETDDSRTLTAGLDMNVSATVEQWDCYRCKVSARCPAYRVHGNESLYDVPTGPLEVLQPARNLG